MQDKLRVLYVDDEPVLLEIGKIYLEKDGNILVETFNSADEALENINSNHYDAIISDYEMPGMDGIRFLRHLKKMGNKTPFIVFTGKGREEVVIEALNCGADFYIQKGGPPKAQFTELSNKIRYAVSRKRTEFLLKESEERYRNVVEDQTEFICRFLPDGTHVFVNDAYCRYFGMERNQITGSKFKPKMPEEDKKKVALLISSLNANNPHIIVEQRIIMSDGSIRWQRWDDRAIFDSESNLKEYQSVGRDITELKEREIALNEKNYELQAAYEQIASSEEELRQQFQENKFALQALYESEKKLQGIVHGSPIPQFVIDKDHRIISWNDALAQYSRIKSEEVLGTKLSWRAFYKTERPLLADLLVDGFIEKIPEWYNGKYQKSRYIKDAYEATDFFPDLGPDGVWLFFTASAIRDSSGNIIGAVETLEDITLRKLKEEALQASEEKFRNIVISVNEAIILQEKTGEILTWNKAAERIFGVTAMEMIGHTTTGQKWKTIYEDGTEFPESDHPSIRTLVSGEACENVIMGITGNDGKFSWVSINTSPLFRNGDLEPYAVIISLLDITERKRAEEEILKKNEELNVSYEEIMATEEELRANLDELSKQQQASEESKQQLNDIIEFLPDATVVVDSQGIVIAWNHAIEKMTGISKNDMIGKGDHAFTIPFYGERRQHLLDLYDLDDTDIKMKYQYIRRKGNTLYAEVFAPALYGGKGAYIWVTGSPLFDTKGNRIGAIESIRDITDRKLAEEALREAALNWQYTFDSNQDGICLLDDKKTLVGTVHSIRDVTERKELEMEMEYHEQELMKSSKSLATANKKLTLLSSITRHDINNQLTVLMSYISILENIHPDSQFSEYLLMATTAAQRISSMIRFTKEYEQIGVHYPIWQNPRKIVDNSAKEAPLGQVILINDLPLGLEVFADPLLLKVCYNLMDNAVRYAGKIQTIHFFIEERNGEKVIVCEDDGIGVQVDDKDRIFERGFGKNTGLGLALSREILDITGITLHETGMPGKGARFEI